MSILCSRITIPPLFSPQYYHPYRRSSLSSLLNHLKLSSAAATVYREASPPPSASYTTSSPLESLTTIQQQQISLYVDTLLQWNQRMNLTAVTEENEVMNRHVKDSLAIVPPLHRIYISRCASGSDRSFEDIRLVDVGSGAGLPGVILAIAYPNWTITLLESMQKRCLFLEHVVGLIGLSNVQIMCERAENAGQNTMLRESFDVVVARAVAEMRILAEYCLPLVRVGGLFLAAKGYNPQRACGQDEVSDAANAIRLLGASLLEICSVESRSRFGQRTAVICHKKRATPKKYPRHLGIPSKSPL